MSVYHAPLVGFKSRKAAQTSAFFAAQCSLEIDKLKLIKLIYLAERDFVFQYGHPMLYDEFFSLQHGPICSSTLTGINGEIDNEIWAQFISIQGYKVKAIKNFTRDEYDEISDAEFDLLKATWDSFGWMNASEIREYSHKNCPEYTEVSKGRIPISYRDLFKALGEENAEELEHEISCYRKAASILRN